jgi:hypothetical protein
MSHFFGLALCVTDRQQDYTHQDIEIKSTNDRNFVHFGAYFPHHPIIRSLPAHVESEAQSHRRESGGIPI